MDHFAAAARHIIQRGRSGCYHITHPEPVTVDRLRDIFASLFGAGGIRMVTKDEFAARPRTRAEKLYQKASAIYQPYLQAEPQFDRSGTDAALAGSGIGPPVLDEPFFRRLLDYARSVGWGRREPKKPKGQGIPDGIERYFSEFLAGKTGQALLPDLRTISATFRVILNEVPGEHWTLAIRHGVLESISRNGHAAQCSYLLDIATFRRIIAGRLSPQKAFFDRMADLEGDVETGLMLVAVLAEFFRKYPFEAGDG